MSKFESPLKNLKVASPCSQDWNAMIGSERKRYCGECKLNVYNLSGMSKIEAENLIMNSEGRLCVRFYQRADGTVLTQDCPVGWAKFKQRTKIYVTALASLIFSFFGALGLVGMFNKTRETTIMGGISPVNITNTTPKNTPQPMMGDVATMGTPVPTPRSVNTPRDIVGKIAVKNR